MDYATPSDFCRVFNDHIDDLYTLSFLLTADRHKAEQCFLSGLQDCLHGHPVFLGWAQSWARRTVVINAIRMISPWRDETETASAIPQGDTPAAAITSLQPFDRFVYVLSILEKYSDRECSILMGCTVRNVVDARIRTLQRLADAYGHKVRAEDVLTEGAA